jgi:hypothetical protein
LLSGKARAVPARSTATAADVSAIIRNLCPRSGGGFLDVLVVGHDPTRRPQQVHERAVPRLRPEHRLVPPSRAQARASVQSTGSCLTVGSALHNRDTNAKADPAKFPATGFGDDTLRACAWHLLLADFATNKPGDGPASMLDGHTSALLH